MKLTVGGFVKKQGDALMAEFVLLEDVEVKAVTGKAILVLVEDLEEEKWIPISCLELTETEIEFKAGAKGTVAVKGWFARKEGLSG